MYPTIEIYKLTISTYALLTVIGAVLGIYIATRRSKMFDIGKEDTVFTSLYAGIGLLIGAKVLSLISSIPIIIEYRKLIFASIQSFAAFFSGGFVFYGGLIGAIIGAYIYCRRYKLDFIAVLDLLAPSVPLIHGFGRLGCFSAGCCYGIEYDGPLHIVFHNAVGAPNGVALLPIQLIGSLINFILFIILIIYGRKLRKPGRVIGLYLIFYSIIRFFLEFLRGDYARGIFFNLSTSQWISLPLLVIGIYMFYKGLEPKNTDGQVTDKAIKYN